MKTVKVIKNSSNGQIFTQNPTVSAKDGKQYGYIIVSELEPSVDFSSGVARVLKPRTAAVAFLASDFEKLNGLYVEGRQLNGKIVIEESTEQKGNAEPMKNPSTDAILTHGGAPIYRYSRFTTNMDAQDLILARDGANVPQTASADASSALNA